MIILVAQIQDPEKNRNGACYLEVAVNVSKDWTQELKWLVLFSKMSLGAVKYQCFLAFVIHCWDGVVKSWRILMLSLYLLKTASCVAHSKVCRSPSAVGSLQPPIRQECHTCKLRPAFHFKSFCCECCLVCL